MKHFIAVLVSSLVPLLLAGQAGDGTSGNPFRGDISTSITWSPGSFTNDIVYIGTSGNPDLRVISDGHLTIEEGLTIIFTQSNSNLIITGSGIFTVKGTASDPVLFTKHPDNSRWGHISFETPGSGTPITGTGSFAHAIFEYGYAATSGTLPSNAGGALQINAKDVVIENCVFRYNYSNFGGAITINAGTDRNTIIRNSYFYENTANQAGGAILTWTSSTPIIENCIFEANNCNGVGNTQYSGGAIWSLQNTTRIINCTFVENTSARTGDAVYSYSSSNMRIINSIFWGSNDQFAGASTTSTINYCAFEDVLPSNASNSIIISNDAAENFSDAGSSDWSLIFHSACRDAGTNSLTGVTIPSLDYDGNQRVHTKDIGAYEYQYSRWRTDAGSADWATTANWDGGVPTSDRDIVIPAGATYYPTGASAPNVTVGSDRYFVMDPGSRATINSLANNGILHLRESSSQFSSIILNSYTRGAGGSERIEVYLSGGGNVDDDNFRWHYISSPVSSLAASVFSDTTDNLAQYVESRPNFSILEGWVAFDGYIYSTGSMGGPTFNTLTTGSNGKGYNYWYNQDRLYTFGGLLTTSDVTAPLGFSGNASRHGFNLLGNPFKSGLDWDYIIDDVNYPLNTSKGLYFTRNNEQCSYIGGVGIPGDVTGIIPPMQGFFTKTYAASNSIILPAAARTHDDIHPRYKGQGTIIPLVRLALAGHDKTDETVVRFDESAKPGLDNNFDALKLFINDNKTYLYTLTEGVKYAINGQPFPEETLEIPVVINVRTTGNHTISATQLQGLDDYRVRLKDLSLNTITDLKQHPDYQFSADKGVITDRFVLQVSYFALSNETIEYSESAIRIYPYAGNINIIPESELWNGKSVNIKVIDLSGKTLAGYSKLELQQGEITTIQAPSARGLYFIQISSGLQKHTGKVMIR